MGITQAELARRVNVRQSYISDIEHNRASPSAQVISSIADVLDTSVDFLLLRSEDPLPPNDEEEDDERAATDLARDALLAEYDRLDEIDQQALHQIAVTLRLAKERRKTTRVIE
jgi:transcriptional regulator with XRE-family HTH domain